MLIAAGAPARSQETPDAVSGFRLPPAPSSTPQPQGPVVEGITAPRAPRPAAPTPAPVASPAPTPVATPTPETATIPDPVTAQPSPVEASTTADDAAESGGSPARAVAAGTDDPAGDSQRAASTGETAVPGFSGVPANPFNTATNGTAGTGSSGSIATSGGTNWWPWAVGIFCVLWIAGGLFWLWRQRQETGGRIITSAIDRPRAQPRDAEQDETGRSAELPLPTLGGGMAATGTAVPSRPPLRCTIEAPRLSLSLLNVTLSYRITLSNETDRAIRNITVGSDMVTAHASVPVDQQLAGSGLRLEPQHRLALLLPDQNAQLSGELRLPIPAIHPLRRGNAVMFVPLLRLRIDGEGMEEMVLQTLVIGQKPAGPGAGLRPFRLDLGPRIYGEIGHRLLAPQG